MELVSSFSDCSMGLSLFLHNIRGSHTIELIENGLGILEVLKQGKNCVEVEKKINLDQLSACEEYNIVKECLKEENFDDFVNEIEILLNHVKDFLKGKRPDEPDEKDVRKVQNMTFKISEPCLTYVSQTVSPFR